MLKPDRMTLWSSTIRMRIGESADGSLPFSVFLRKRVKRGAESQEDRGR
jgi:hypothetical protein